MTGEESLLRLAASTAEAVSAALEALVSERVDREAPALVPQGKSPFQGIPEPAVACSVRYVEGVTGGNVLILSRPAARHLAALMMGGPPPTGELADADLSELELSAVGEAMNQMMSAAAAAIGSVLEQEIEISPPEIRLLDTAAQAQTAFELTPWAAAVTLAVCGQPGRLILLVPHAFVVRMTRALDELGGEAPGETEGEQGLPPQAVRSVRVRVSAELGRAPLALGRLVALAGQVVELDRSVDDPIQVLVNGRPFAWGRLLVADGEWAVRIEEIQAGSETLATSQPRKE